MRNHISSVKVISVISLVAWVTIFLSIQKYFGLTEDNSSFKRSLEEATALLADTCIRASMRHIPCCVCVRLSSQSKAAVNHGCVLANDRLNGTLRSIGHLYFCAKRLSPALLPQNLSLALLQAESWDGWLKGQERCDGCILVRLNQNNLYVHFCSRNALHLFVYRSYIVR